MLSAIDLQFLQGIPLFKDIEQDQALSRLAANLEEVQLPADHPILVQGEQDGHLYILRSGSVRVHLGDLELTTLGPGAYFGEMSLFDGGPASASVTTCAPVICLRLDRAQMGKAIADCPEIGLSLIRGLAVRIRQLNQRLSGWLRGLLTLAWADGQYNPEEQAAIVTLVHTPLEAPSDKNPLPPISGAELAALLGSDNKIAQNFLRSAMIVALANGTYSEAEDAILREFCVALGQPTDILDPLRTVLLSSSSEGTDQAEELTARQLDVLQPVRQWLDELEIDTPHQAHFLCKLIPAQCPFERDIVLFGRKIVHIPPMCKLNPLYDQLVNLRFRALSYLADECKEDVTPYLS